MLDELREQVALDEFHHQVVRADVVEGADVGVIERGNGSGFAFEAISELARRDFDGDRAAQARVRAAVDFAHAAFAD